MTSTAYYPGLVCPTAKLLASSLDGSFDAAILVSAPTGEVLHKNLHAALLILGDHEADDSQAAAAADESTDQNQLLSRWIELQDQTWDDILKGLSSTASGNQQDDDAFVAHGGAGTSAPRISGVAATLKKDGMAVMINFTRSILPVSCTCSACSSAAMGCSSGNDERFYVTAYLKTDSSKLSVDEVSALQLDKDLVDGSFDPMFVIDDEGSILMMNEASVKAFGYTYKELLHKNISMLCGGGHGVHHATYMKNYADTGHAKIIGKIRKTYARRKDGTEFPVDLGVRQVSSSDGIHTRLYCGYMKDTTAQEKHEAELNHRELLMQGMINASFDPMFQINEKGIIQMCNNAASCLFGWTREQLIGTNISIICGADHARNHDQYIQDYLNTGIKKVIGRKRVVPAMRKDGTTFDIELGIQEVTCSDTGERMFCGYIRDLTQQRLDKRMLRKRDELMKGKFFGTGDHNTLEHQETL